MLEWIVKNIQTHIQSSLQGLGPDARIKLLIVLRDYLNRVLDDEA